MGLKVKKKQNYIFYLSAQKAHVTGLMAITNIMMACSDFYIVMESLIFDQPY